MARPLCARRNASLALFGCLQKVSLALFGCLLFVLAPAHGSGIPRFTLEPQSAVTRLASTLTLSCVAQPDSAAIKWTFNGAAIVQPAQRQRRLYDIRDGSLRIASFSPTHEGVYQCVASNALGTVLSAEARLEAAALGTFESARTVTDIIALEGNVAVVPCSPPTSRPAAVIEFELNGTKLTPSPHYVILPSGNLQIANVSQSDRGAYQCSAFNHVTGARIRSSATHKLSIIGAGVTPVPATVIWAPQESVTFVQDADLTLECAAEGFPVPAITWEKYGGHLPVGRFTQILGNLLIRAAQKFDAGTYLCKVNNGADAAAQQQRVVSVDVLEMPVIEVAMSDQNATEGSTIVFKCRSQAAAKVTMTWKFNGNTLVNGQFVAVRDTTLTLSNVQLKQSGAYQCIAKNNIGMAYATARLSVVDPQRSSAAKPGSASSNAKDFADDEEEEEEDEDEDDSSYGLVGPERSKAIKPGRVEDTAVSLAAPSRPEVNKLSDTSVVVHWSLPPTPSGGGSPQVTAFRVQYKDDRSPDWQTVEEDVAASQRQYEVQRLRPGSAYRFRVAAIYSNHDSRSSRNSAKVSLGAVQQSKSTTSGPIIVEARPLSISEIFIGWQQHDADGWPVEGFHIYYAPFDEEIKYQKQTVVGSNVRHAVLSHLAPATSYSIRVQSYNAMGSESEFSNTVVKQTLSYTNEPLPDSGVSGSGFPRSNSRGGATRNRNGPPGDSDSPGASDRPPVVEEYSGGRGGGGGGKGEGQLLYIVLGVVLGVVVVVAVACAAVCVWKQQLQQRVSGTAKECKKLQTSDQLEAFLETSALKPEQGQVQGHSKGRVHQLTVNGSHVPGCGGKCSAGGLHGVTDCTRQARKGAPDLMLPPPPPMPHPPTHLGVQQSYYSPDGSNGAMLAPSPIYTRLPDLDDSRSSGASERQRGISMQGPCVQSSSANQGGPLPIHVNAQHSYAPTRVSPDHIPRSHEQGVLQPPQHPYWVLDRRPPPSEGGGGSSAGSRGSGERPGGGGDRGGGEKVRRAPQGNGFTNAATQRLAAGSLGDNNSVEYALPARLDPLPYSSLDRPTSSHDSLNTGSLGTNSVFPPDDSSCNSLDAPELYAPHFLRGGDFPPPAPSENSRQPAHQRHRIGINPADYQFGRGGEGVPTGIGCEGWKSLANQVSDGTYNLGGTRSAGPITSGVVGSPRANEYPASDQEGYR